MAYRHLAKTRPIGTFTMQIGLRIGPQNAFTPVPEYLAFIRRAEDLGFDPLLFSDTVSLSHFHVRDPFVLMALAAGATRRAGLGTGVTTPFTRHPSVVANAFGSIDDAIAPRKTFLGIGSGDTAVYLIGKRAARLAEMREYLKVLRALLDGEPVTFEGADLALELAQAASAALPRRRRAEDAGGGGRACRRRDPRRRHDTRGAGLGACLHRRGRAARRPRSRAACRCGSI